MCIEAESRFPAFWCAYNRIHKFTCSNARSLVYIQTTSTHLHKVSWTLATTTDSHITKTLVQAGGPQLKAKGPMSLASES